jgi:hypothetical protein
LGVIAGLDPASHAAPRIIVGLSNFNNRIIRWL